MTTDNKELRRVAETSDIDFYELLEIPPESQESSVQSAYRKIALKCHPDKKKNHPSHEFVFLTQVRDILCNTELRNIYDRRQQQKKEPHKGNTDRAYDGGEIIWLGGEHRPANWVFSGNKAYNGGRIYQGGTIEDMIKVILSRKREAKVIEESSED